MPPLPPSRSDSEATDIMQNVQVLEVRDLSSHLVAKRHKASYLTPLGLMEEQKHLLPNSFSTDKMGVGHYITMLR